MAAWLVSCVFCRHLVGPGGFQDECGYVPADGDRYRYAGRPRSSWPFGMDRQRSDGVAGQYFFRLLHGAVPGHGCDSAVRALWPRVGPWRVGRSGSVDVRRQRRTYMGGV